MKTKILLVFMVIAMIFSGCSSEEVRESAVWDRDILEHWQNGENGEKLRLGEHELDGAGICSVCGCEIIDWGDGTFEVYSYDAFGNLSRLSLFGAGNEIIEDYENIFEYDEKGNPLSLKVYQNGFLCGESLFSYNSEGGTFESECTSYYSDGSYTVEEYNENGNSVLFRTFDSEGKLLSESVNEFITHPDGFDYVSRVISTDLETGAEYVYEYNEHSDLLSLSEYDSEKNLIYEEKHEYSYNEDGNKAYHKTILNGVPAEEIYFGYSEDGGGWWSYYDIHIVYEPDGSCTMYDYDENEVLLSESRFDPDGNPVE